MSAKTKRPAKKKIVLVQITSCFEQDQNRPRPKWWDNYIGEQFRCYELGHDGCWKLTASALKKLTTLKGSTTYSAIIYKSCGKVVTKQKKTTHDQTTTTKTGRYSQEARPQQTGN